MRLQALLEAVPALAETLIINTVDLHNSSFSGVETAMPVSCFISYACQDKIMPQNAREVSSSFSILPIATLHQALMYPYQK